ncbi:ISH3-like element ISC1359 family transposase [Saccharolobus solfataricus]|uniref:ISH3 family transposase n=1 Tax=Saccharolobus solfataricus TaxID=2287 RepID=A0A7S9NR58_SACSO|nr:ISH3-like element ISC1359 family transposase [Saccharolobus solfataricus]QPG49769.1 ISH3 family transposase [Saccharolobus solfataricus]
MKHENTTKPAKFNRDFARSALKIIYSILTKILFPEELLSALLKASGSYLSRLGKDGRRALRKLNAVQVEDVRDALRKMGRMTLRGVRDRRVAVDFHAIPQYHADKSFLSRIKPTKGTSWGLVQAAIFLLGRTRSFLDVIPVTVKNVAEGFKAVMEVIVKELEEDKLRLVMVFADREFAVNEVIRFLLELGLDFVISAKAQMYKKYKGMLQDVDVSFGGVRYTGFLCVRHGSGAYLIILRKEDDKIIAFLVRREMDLYDAIVLAEMYRERWGIENAFRSLEEFRIKTRTCDVRKELVLVLLSYLLLNVWFLIRSWRKVKLWEFSVSLSNLLDREVRVEQERAFREVKTSFPQTPANPMHLLPAT